MDDLAWVLQEMQAWIITGGAVAPATVEPMKIVPLSNSQPLAMSNGESEVSASNKDLPTPQRVLSKVWRVDDIEHVLDKGAWETTPAMF